MKFQNVFVFIIIYLIFFLSALNLKGHQEPAVLGETEDDLSSAKVNETGLELNNLSTNQTSAFSDALLHSIEGGVLIGIQSKIRS